MFSRRVVCLSPSSSYILPRSRCLQAAKEMAASNTSSKKEEEKLKKEGRLYKVRHHTGGLPPPPARTVTVSRLTWFLFSCVFVYAFDD